MYYRCYVWGGGGKCTVVYLSILSKNRYVKPFETTFAYSTIGERSSTIGLDICLGTFFVFLLCLQIGLTLQKNPDYSTRRSIVWHLKKAHRWKLSEGGFSRGMRW